MIKIKLGELVNSTEVLQKLSQTELKAKLSWAVTKLLKAADKEMQDFNEARMNLIQKYGEKDENGELITDENKNCKIPEAGLQKFSAELNELVETEIEINVNPLNINDLEDKEFTPAEMAILEPFIDFGEEE